MDLEDFLRSTPDELQHFGVKGMKWGRRKPSEKKLAKKDAKWEKKIESKKAVISARAYNHAVPKINSLVKTHQEKAKGWKESDPRWKYLEDEFGKELISIYCIVYPIIIGVIFSVFGYLVFKKKDLV